MKGLRGEGAGKKVCVCRAVRLLLSRGRTRHVSLRPSHSSLACNSQAVVAEDELQFAGGRAPTPLGRGQTRDGSRSCGAYVRRAQPGRSAGRERARELDQTRTHVILVMEKVCGCVGG